MKVPALWFRSILGKAALASLALGGFLLFAGAPAAKANAWDDCNRRVAYTNLRYQEAVERHEAYERLEHCHRDWR